MVKSLWGGCLNLTFQRHFGSEQREQGYCFSNPCHEGLGSPKKHLGWQWGDMISLSQCAHGNLASRKELTKGFVGATRHGVTGQDPAGSGGFARCHLAQGQLGSVFPCSRTELRFEQAWTDIELFVGGKALFQGDATYRSAGLVLLLLFPGFLSNRQLYSCAQQARLPHQALPEQQRPFSDMETALDSRGLGSSIP